MAGVAVAADAAGERFDDHVRRHAPDFFARRHDGRAVVVDVRPDDRIPEWDEQKFAVTAEACEAAGWDYLRSGDLDPGDGRERAVAVALPAPAVPEVAAVLLEAFDGS